MEKHAMYYDMLVKVTNAISQCKDPEEVALLTVESVTTALKVKGCSVFLVNRETGELGLAASYGLSQEYLTKGPVRYMQELGEVKDQVPIAIYDVQDDPRIQYPEAAKKEGISSLLGVPIVAHNQVVGALRIYTAEPWEFSMQDITLVQAVGQICGMAMDMCRLYKGYKTSIEILKNLRGKEYYQSRGWTPYEGIPKSYTK
ncbi:MAG: GAF domain-containing protein [Desulfobacterales bacterium]|jgi:signal transduction protein with GAF and PtsI domain|nr:GAF domain-containing protein [Desulfobacterales bacterium]